MFGSTISKFLKLDNLLEHLTGYVETKVELVKLEARQEVAAGLSRAITYLIMAFVGGMFMMFLSFALAVLLASAIGDFAGFSIVAGFYLIVLLALYFNREKINSSFAKTLSSKFKKKK